MTYHEEMVNSCEIEEGGDLSMAALLDALSDKTRQQNVYTLSIQPTLCTGFGDLGTKTRLSYHYAQLRKAGLTAAEKHGTSLMMSLRLREVEAVFPGFLKAVLKGFAAEQPSLSAKTPGPLGRNIPSSRKVAVHQPRRITP